MVVGVEGEGGGGGAVVVRGGGWLKGKDVGGLERHGGSRERKVLSG